MDFKENYSVRRISSYGSNFFFGYYDLPAFNKSSRYHLCHNPGFIDRLHNEKDSCDIGIIDLKTYEYIKIDETYAWNFQQGSMLQWNPQNPEEEIIYNCVNDGKYCSVVRNIKTKDKRILPLPVANVSKTGEIAVSINFSRLYDFRPGYGYAYLKDEFFNDPIPENDGIYLMDMISGNFKLILSMKDIAKFLKENSKFFVENEKLLINHITLNPTGTRIVALVRNFRTGPKSTWKTFVMTCDTSGKNLSLINKDNTLASHYYWKDDIHILFFSGGPYGNNLYIINDKTDEHIPVNIKYFDFDGHCSYSNDKNIILYDSYPQKNYRKLFFYNVKEDKLLTLNSFYSIPEITGDFRCDLHPRWNSDNSMISIDSVHEGFRGIYVIE